MNERPLSLRARWVFPVSAPPIRNGQVVIAGGRIAHVGPAPKGGTADLDLGDSAIVPGFVNAHTHLELGPVPAPAGGGPEDEIDWLARVVAGRRDGTIAPGPKVIAANVAASVTAGVTAIADTSTVGQSWEAIAAAPMRGIVFAEIIGLNRMRGLQTSEAAFDWLALVRDDDPGRKIRPGLSPHAPYSTAGWLYHRAAASKLPLSTHLAELPEEAELLGTRSGRLRTFLEGLGAWDDAWDPIGPRPADYIRRGDLRHSDWIVAHGTYFDPSEYWQLRPGAAPEGQRVAVAYCPRTHARFGHAPHPFRSMLERGIVVCLGTDSLASTPSLSILDEIRFLFRRDPTLSGELLLTMATLFGAWALRLDDIAGSLAPGKSADLAVIPLPSGSDIDPYRLLLKTDAPVLATMFEGSWASGPWA
ncbi:amidohydrolase family protein [Tundrisphaera sp. TA3]|uniref:amidohydrolase family protein n=1 Tax=Tundrisphaera sp. TA3 TaxID=3435775 RepID=UPI003EBF1530